MSLLITKKNIPMKILELSENFDFVFEKLKNLKFTGGIRLVPTAENAINLLILHDIKDLVKEAKQGDSFNEPLLQKILEVEFADKANLTQFYNFRKTLENPEYLSHLSAMLSK